MWAAATMPPASTEWHISLNIQFSKAPRTAAPGTLSTAWKAWEYNGAVYVINTTSLRQMPLGKFKRRRMCPMDAARSIDLDTPLDWLVAEAVVAQMAK